MGYGKNNLRLRRNCASASRHSGLVDVPLQHETDGPEFMQNRSRPRAAATWRQCRTVRNATQCQPLIIGAVSPNFWTDLSSAYQQYYLFLFIHRNIGFNSLRREQHAGSGLLTVGVSAVPGDAQHVRQMESDTVRDHSNQSNIQPVFEVYAKHSWGAISASSHPTQQVTVFSCRRSSRPSQDPAARQVQSMKYSFRSGHRFGMRCSLRLSAMVVIITNFGSVSCDPRVAITLWRVLSRCFS